MKTFHLFICASFLIFSYSTFAAGENSLCDTKSFSCYKENIKNLCSAPNSAWNVGPNFGKITEDYADFTPEAQNAKTKEILANETNPESKAKLEKELNLDRIGSFDGFRSVEIARIQYRNNMNRVFSCAIAAGRSERISKIEELIDKKFSGKGSDIKEKLKKERKRYENIRNELKCNQTTDSSKNEKIVDKLARSATLEYCSYQYYLDYLDANIKQDYSATLEKEKKIGTNNTSTIPKNTDAFLQKLTKSIGTIENELYRADGTIRKALIAYREMERTYTIHIVLMIIYDDYLNLRDNLKSYMNTLSQTFEKANNAQDANQK